MFAKLVRSKSCPARYLKVTKQNKNSPKNDDEKQQRTLTDCWEYIICNHNTIRLKNHRKKEWISCFGTLIVTKGQYKRWQIKILPINKGKKGGIAKVMIGVCSIESLRDSERGNALNSEFWKGPYFGYAFDGEKGKKYHNSSVGIQYSNKYRIGDTITVELNRTSNRYIMHNDLKFYTNEKVNGQAFTVDHERNYVLAVGICSDKYDIQISN